AERTNSTVPITATSDLVWAWLTTFLGTAERCFVGHTGSILIATLETRRLTRFKIRRTTPCLPAVPRTFSQVRSRSRRTNTPYLPTRPRPAADRLLCRVLRACWTTI